MAKKRSRIKDFLWRHSAGLATTVMVLFVACLGFVGFTYVTVTKKFDSSRRWDLPSRIYSDATPLVPGMTYPRALLEPKLNHVGYHEVKERVANPIDGRDAEGRYGREPSHEMTPERLYDRRWALTLLDRVLARLAGEMDRAGKGALFARLEPKLLGGRGAAPYADVAGELGLSEGAVKVAAHRLRRRYRELLRAEIGRTVDDPTGVDREINELFAALACRERGGLM